MSEYRDRQHEFPDEIGNTLAAYLGGVFHAHNQNRISEAQFTKTVADMKNIIANIQLGEAGIEQAMTAMLDLPLLDYVDDEGFGLDTGKLKMNMRVNAHTREVKKDEGGVEENTEGSAGGGIAGGIFGAPKVKTSITGHFSHSAEQAHESDYTAYTEIEVTLKRTKPAPARRFLSELLGEMKNELKEARKGRQAEQKARMASELNQSDPPKRLPERKESNAQNDYDFNNTSENAEE